MLPTLSRCVLLISTAQRGKQNASTRSIYSLPWCLLFPFCRRKKAQTNKWIGPCGGGEILTAVSNQIYTGRVHLLATLPAPAEVWHTQWHITQSSPEECASQRRHAWGSTQHALCHSAAPWTQKPAVSHTLLELPRVWAAADTSQVPPALSQKRILQTFPLSDPTMSSLPPLQRRGMPLLSCFVGLFCLPAIPPLELISPWWHHRHFLMFVTIPTMSWANEFPSARQNDKLLLGFHNEY